ncbi:peptidoglycan-binding protein [Streptomyces sp. NPDC057702]|uniref:peptidoglycan-binding protein n=1 Tax=unclassified Streptomyces TaxID=2593676 RepID=UPI0036799C65
MPTFPIRPAAVAAALFVAGALLAAPGAAAQPTPPRRTPPHPTEPDPQATPRPATAAAPGQGVAWFQARHGLPPTGAIDPATASALRYAPAADLRQTFRTAADLGPEERANARTVIGVGKGADIPEQSQVIALMTAMQESKFVNYLEPVDHDSLGVFQQRPSMGWGTPEQITDVATSARSFYGVAPFGDNPGLLQIDGWPTMPPGDVCQAVQVSAYPERYARWEPFARDLLAQEGPTVLPIP